MGINPKSVPYTPVSDYVQHNVYAASRMCICIYTYLEIYTYVSMVISIVALKQTDNSQGYAHDQPCVLYMSYSQFYLMQLMDMGPQREYKYYGLY